MAETSAGENEDKNLSRVDSLTKILRSPSRSNSFKSKSPSSPLSRFIPKKLFSRKSSSKRGSNSFKETTEPEEVESIEMDPSALVDEVKELTLDTENPISEVESGKTDPSPLLDEIKEITSLDENLIPEVESGKMNPSPLLDEVKELTQLDENLIPEMTSETASQVKDEVITEVRGIESSSRDIEVTTKVRGVESSTETKEHKFGHFFDKAKGKLEKSIEGLKEKAEEGVEKAKEVIDRGIYGKGKYIYEDIDINQVKAPNVVDRVKEEVIAVVDSIQSFTKKDDSFKEIDGKLELENAGEQSSITKDETSKEIEGEKKVEPKEDGCVASLGLWLHKVCAPSSTKKDD